MVDIAEVIRAKRLAATKKSISFQETRDKLLHNKAEATKQQLTTAGTEAKNVAELEMSQLYYRMYDEYYQKSSIRMPHSMNKRSLTLWKRVVKSCTQAGVTAEQYMRAQFAFFHKQFGTAPSLCQLATDNAVERAQKFVGNSTGKVIGNTSEFKGDFAQIMRAAEMQMQQLCRLHSMTREDVYIKLVVPGLILFPIEYLKADPVYKKVIND